MQGSKRDTDVKNRLGLCGRRRGWDYLRDSIETCMLPYVKQMTSASSMHETGHSKPVPWENSEGWRGEGSGRGASGWGGHMYPWLIHVNVWQKPPQYCNYPPVK